MLGLDLGLAIDGSGLGVGVEGTDLEVAQSGISSLPSPALMGVIFKMLVVSSSGVLSSPIEISTKIAKYCIKSCKSLTGSP